MKKKIFILLLAIIGICQLNLAQAKLVINDKKGWHKIGETIVNFSKDKDEVSVVGANKFASLIFKVDDAPIDLIDIEVFYEKGDNQKVTVNFPIKAPGQSKEIDLNGGERSVKKIEFVYKTLPNRKDMKAHVEIWGLKTNTDKK